MKVRNEILQFFTITQQGISSCFHPSMKPVHNTLQDCISDSHYISSYSVQRGSATGGVGGGGVSPYDLAKDLFLFACLIARGWSCTRMIPLVLGLLSTDLLSTKGLFATCQHIDQVLRVVNINCPIKHSTIITHTNVFTWNKIISIK